MNPGLAAQASLVLVAASPYVGRSTRRALGPVVAQWRQDRAWARGLRAVHNDHYAAVEPAIRDVLDEMELGLAFGPGAWEAACDRWSSEEVPA